jgi:hypothetical protein
MPKIIMFIHILLYIRYRGSQACEVDYVYIYDKTQFCQSPRMQGIIHIPTLISLLN